MRYNNVTAKLRIISCNLNIYICMDIHTGITQLMVLNCKVTFLIQHHNYVGQVTKPIILVNICYQLAILYVIQVVKRSLISDILAHFLASADIRDFGHTYVYTYLHGCMDAVSCWPCTFFKPVQCVFA